jgi:hypothetical protein
MSGLKKASLERLACTLFHQGSETKYARYSAFFLPAAACLWKIA